MRHECWLNCPLCMSVIRQGAHCRATAWRTLTQEDKLCSTARLPARPSMPWLSASQPLPTHPFAPRFASSLRSERS